MLGIGVIGYGYWGPNWVRNFAELPDARLVAVSDLRPDRLALAARRFPAIRTTTDVRELLADPAVDAVVIATPVSTHYELASLALRAGKHVLVEKPLTPTVEQGLRLAEEAERRGLVLMVDHTFVYTSAVRKIKELAADGMLGELYYYDSVRVNLGLFQHDVNVLWDLAVHDLSIMDYLIDARPVAVSATGMAHVSGRAEDIAYLTCFFEGTLIAHIHVNWLAPVKVRRTLLAGARQMIVYDDLEPSEKVKVYDRGITLNDAPEGLYRMLVDYRLGDVWAPQLKIGEALQTEAQHFVDCVTRGRRPDTDGAAGLRVVHILETATQSLARRGEPVALQWEGLQR
ncbi:MAG: Gfo/Idh/MocA family oxidoreductase [Chloroflexota bacterium]|nr:MAG: oxidoreductase [Chloroflexota bacterium]